MFGEEKIFGKSEISIDEKNRIKLPKFTYAESGDRIIIQQEDDTLKISNESKITKIIEEIEETLKHVENISEAKTLKEKIDKLCISIISKKICDQQNRIILPNGIFDTSETNRIMSVGYGDYIKLYTLKKYNELSK